jgi:hypothetical protein
MPDRMTKRAAGYTDRAPDNARPCVLCAHFDPMPPTCARVDGRVLPMGTCELWAVPKEAE